jgi:beta-phosphoglucomutase
MAGPRLWQYHHFAIDVSLASDEYRPAGRDVGSATDHDLTKTPRCTKRAGNAHRDEPAPECYRGEANLGIHDRKSHSRFSHGSQRSEVEDVTRNVWQAAQSTTAIPRRGDTVTKNGKLAWQLALRLANGFSPRAGTPLCRGSRVRSELQPWQTRLAPTTMATLLLLPHRNRSMSAPAPAHEPQAAIFDMDGVLIDSYRAHFESCLRVAAELGRVYTEEQFAAGFGRTTREVIAEQWQWEGEGQGERLSDDEIARIDERKEGLFREIIAADFPAMAGAVELIESLVQAGFRVAVGSSGPRENVQLAIDRLGIGKLLSAIVTGHDVKHGKPDPQVFMLAAERCGIAPGRCVVVEDAPAGIEAARRGGMHVIGLASTGRTVEQLRAADLVVTSLHELSPRNFVQVLQTAAKPHSAR